MEVNIYSRGFGPAAEVLLFRQKDPKPFLPQRGPKGVPGEAFLPSGGCATRSEVKRHLSAQTVLAENPGGKKPFLATLKGEEEEKYFCPLFSMVSFPGKDWHQKACLTQKGTATNIIGVRLD